MPDDDLLIRPLHADDETEWRRLWAGYLDFYQVRLAPEMTDLTFSRLIAGQTMSSLMAFASDGTALGLVHYIFHASTWSKGGYCYLEDLYVTPQMRGKSLGRALIAAVEEKARQHGATRLYWHTEEFNGTARRLYERLAKRAPFIRYQIGL